MKIYTIKHLVVLHTDLHLYWHARLSELQKALHLIGVRLDVVEIAGKGSPYAFEKVQLKNKELNWHILFPQKAMEEISSALIQTAIGSKLKELDPDVVMAGAIAFQSGTGALKWKAATGKPIIIFDDARPEDVKRSKLVNTIKKIFYRNVDAVICPAPSHAKGFTWWNLKKEEIFYGIDVIDNDFFKKNDSQIKKQVIEVNILQPYLLAVGRQIEIKNCIGLLKAFVHYKTENPASILNLVFIGDGPLNRSLMEKAVKRKDVILIHFVQQNILVQYYQQARGLVLSSYGETWGLVVNEAMAAGLPVLVSNQCGCSSTLVHEGVNGWTFDPGNTNEMTGVIRKLDHLSQEQWEKMGQSSMDIIKDWGLPRFTQGVMDAIIYISTKPKIKSGWMGNLLIRFWNGRYRPV